MSKENAKQVGVTILALVFRGFVLCLVVAALLIPSGAGSAQDAEFRLNMQRNFGFSSGSMIRGLFTASVIGPQTIQAVTFLLDDQVMANVTQAPFQYKFDTGQYPDGWHNLSAVVLTADGRKVTTPVRSFQFASAAEESASTQKIMLPILGIAFILVVLGFAAPMLGMRKKSKVSLPLGAARHYGLAGGTVCPNCQRPFALHWWGLNLLTGKYDRCDYCGRTGIFRRASREELAAAEMEELRQAQPDEPIREKSEDEKLQEMLDNSRYTDGM